MRSSLILFAALGLQAPALAQTAGPIELELGIDATTVISLAEDDDPGAETETMLGEFTLGAQVQRVLENGVRLRARTALRYQYDHPSRPGFTGGFGSIPGAPTGAFSGMSLAPALSDGNGRVRFETAYLQVDGGYGELRAGRDLGVAARFHEGAPDVLSHARLDSALLDPSGLASIRSRHDLTGPSLKLSYASPRLLGLRAGASFTPRADADGLDRRPAVGTGLSAPEIDNAIELALNGSRRLPGSGLRIDGALAWSTAETRDRAGLAPYGRVDTVSAGTRMELGDWSWGGSWLSSDNGLPNGDYEAWSLGFARNAFDIDWSLTYGESRDDTAIIDSSGWRFGAARALGENARLALAYRNDEIQKNPVTIGSQGIVVEITLSSEILKLSGN